MVGCSKAPTPKGAPKAHHVANKTQERHYARSSGTNALVLEQTRDKCTSALECPSNARKRARINVVTDHLLN